MRSGALARLLRGLYGDEISPEEQLELDVEIFTGSLYSFTDDQQAALMRIATSKNLKAEQFARLVWTLRGTRDESQGIVLDALGHFPQYLPSYLVEIYNHLPDEDYYGPNPSPEQTALREDLLAKWRKLVCLAFPPGAGEISRQVVLTKSNLAWNDAPIVVCKAGVK